MTQQPNTDSQVIFSTLTETRGRLFYFFFIYHCAEGEGPLLASSGRHGDHRVEQHPGGDQELPDLHRQEQGYVSRMQEQASRLPTYRPTASS